MHAALVLSVHDVFGVAQLQLLTCSLALRNFQLCSRSQTLRVAAIRLYRRPLSVSSLFILVQPILILVVDVHLQLLGLISVQIIMQFLYLHWVSRYHPRSQDVRGVSLRAGWRNVEGFAKVCAAFDDYGELPEFLRFPHRPFVLRVGTDIDAFPTESSKSTRAFHCCLNLQLLCFLGIIPWIRMVDDCHFVNDRSRESTQ